MTEIYPNIRNLARDWRYGDGMTDRDRIFLKVSDDPTPERFAMLADWLDEYGDKPTDHVFAKILREPDTTLENIKEKMIDEGQRRECIPGTQIQAGRFVYNSKEGLEMWRSARDLAHSWVLLLPRTHEHHLSHAAGNES